MHTKTVLDALNKNPKLLLSVILIIFLAAPIIDVLTGNSIYFEIFYLLLILLTAWFVGGVSVALIAALCSIDRLAATVASGHIYSHFATTIYEVVMALCLFLLAGYSVAIMKKCFERSYALPLKCPDDVLK